MEPSTKPRILVADDELDLLVVYRAVLSHAGYHVDTVASGQTAVDRFRSEPYDVVLTDLTMPGMNGIDLLRAIRALDLDVPVVIVTAAPSMESAIRAVEYGALHYLVKPVRHDELLRVVKKAVRLQRMAQLKREALAIVGSSKGAIGDRAGLEVTFDAALKQLYIHYQPIVSWPDKKVVAHEALVRSHESRMANPGALFEAAERLGRNQDLGRAIRQLAPRPFACDSVEGKLFLNLHTSELADDALYDANTDLSRMADRVVLEITERASLDHISDVPYRVASLRSLGFRIAVDDLGAGYAGLTAFSLLEPDVCKLDMTIVRDVDKSATKQKLVHAMSELCRDMGIELVAEGIQTTQERDELLELGCHLFQGYLFARPGEAFPEVTW